mmetsp:Transcript_138167/g.240247  ORF Transcript_138167/g.240247 Transcript_138167/m.240247 type:complete len:256 (+) Transcript_138167:198-965(+)
MTSITWTLMASGWVSGASSPRGIWTPHGTVSWLGRPPGSCLRWMKALMTRTSAMRMDCTSARKASGLQPPPAPVRVEGRLERRRRRPRPWTRPNTMRISGTSTASGPGSGASSHRSTAVAGVPKDRISHPRTSRGCLRTPTTRTTLTRPARRLGSVDSSHQRLFGTPREGCGPLPLNRSRRASTRTLWMRTASRPRMTASWESHMIVTTWMATVRGLGRRDSSRPRFPALPRPSRRPLLSWTKGSTMPTTGTRMG